jgi:hypothetical protein
MIRNPQCPQCGASLGFVYDLEVQAVDGPGLVVEVCWLECEDCGWESAVQRTPTGQTEEEFFGRDVMTEVY